MIVVLPLPFGPSSATHSPRAMVMEKSRNTGCAPAPVKPDAPDAPDAPASSAPPLGKEAPAMSRYEKSICSSDTNGSPPNHDSSGRILAALFGR